MSDGMSLLVVQKYALQLQLEGNERASHHAFVDSLDSLVFFNEVPNLFSTCSAAWRVKLHLQTNCGHQQVEL